MVLCNAMLELSPRLKRAVKIALKLVEFGYAPNLSAALQLVRKNWREGDFTSSEHCQLDQVVEEQLLDEQAQAMEDLLTPMTRFEPMFEILTQATQPVFPLPEKLK